MRNRSVLAVLPALALAFAGCSDLGTDPGSPQFNHEAAKQSLVTPTLNSGNFAIEDNQELCYAAFEGTNTDLTGFTLVGFKIDPVGANYGQNFVNGGVSVQSTDGIYLQWTSSAGVTVLGVVVKGGNNYNFYDYINGPYTTGGPFPDHDEWLHSPLSVKRGKTIVPEISHVNFCASQDAGGDEGCTPGYWRNHLNRWTGVASGDDFDATFDVDAFTTDITLATAVALGGGGINALARHATAALLNAHGGIPNLSDGETVDYPYEVDDVLAMVKAAIDSGDAVEIEATKDLLAAANELGCPLSGTPAT